MLLLADLKLLHTYSNMNKHAIEASDQVGCFCCRKIWDPHITPIERWIDGPYNSRMPHTGSKDNRTALCPFCAIDAVLARLSVGEITPEMLRAMCDYWFEPSGRIGNEQSRGIAAAGNLE
jgi:hypothetical protein